jgi:hypothetical protein
MNPNLAAAGPAVAASSLERIPLPPAAESRLCGMRRSRIQPAAKLADGNLSMY